MLTVHHIDDLDRRAIERVAFAGERLIVTEEALASVARARGAMLSALEIGRRVYGVTTGMGFLSTLDLDADEQASHQRRLLLARAVGSPPWLPREEVRAILLVRLAEFLRGHAGVSVDLCRFLWDRLNDDFCPTVPERAIGSAGEVQPLAHAFQTFLGEGRVLDGTATAPACKALRERGVEPYVPGVKEGIALLAGAPAAVALAIARLRESARIADQALVGAAGACEAMGVPDGPYDPVLGQLAEDPLLEEVLISLADMLAERTPRDSGPQAPVSFRVIPQVLAELRRTAGRLAQDTDRRLRASTDSPAFVDGRFITSGAFHAVDIAAGLDHLAGALVRTAELTVARIHRLLDQRFSGLPAQLTPRPGTCSGLVVVHKRAVGALNELRRLAVPASIGLVDTSLGQEDAQTFTFESAAKLRRVEALVTEITACELLCVRQAWWLRGAPVGSRLVPLAETLADQVAPVAEDRPLGEDIDRILRLLQEDALPRPGNA